MRTIVHQIASAPYVLPLYLEPVKAGFPSPADDFIETRLDLNDYLVKHPASTFFVRVSGNFLDAGIYSGDLLVIDRSRTVYDGAIVVIVINGEFTVKKFNQKMYAIDLQIWGLVTYVIHKT